MERIVVVGGGAMGAGIATVAAAAGFETLLVEPDAAARERAAARAPSVRVVERIPHDSEVTLAIEAVPERLELKRSVFRALEEALPEAVLATNTSSLSVAEIAAAVRTPERVTGTHFFNPPEKMQLVEIVRAPRTSEAALARARDFAERLGKTAVVTADSPGFIVNRVARPFYLQAIRALEAGVAPIEQLDALARSIGFRMGPFELMDFIGLDVNLATSESIYERTREERLEPQELQRSLVAQGLLGRKSGAGFYACDRPLPRLDLRRERRERRDGERDVAVTGDGARADELRGMSANAAIVVDAGDGVTDRGEAIAASEATLDPACVILVDAYATDVTRCAGRLRYPQRLIGYGIVGPLAHQKAIELVAHDRASRDALAAASDAFARLGCGAVEVKDVPGLFLGRVVASIVEEARIVVETGVAGAQDVDLAMRLGTNYPRGPIAWGEEIGARRVARVLERL